MKYRKDKYGNDISILGFGCMRFTKKGGSIDFDKAEKEIMEAYKQGINYFDTAYIYPGSEALIGSIFEKNKIRDKIYIATKLPHYMLKSVEAAEKLFQEELRRLKSDYVDYYLMHMLSDDATWNRLVEMGIKDWIESKKASGQIRQIGFSYHGNSETFCKLIDAYDWDFAQIQYNYLDKHSQAGKTGLDYAYNKNIPVIIMEPLRGGRLANALPTEAIELFKKYPLQLTPPQWAFRWLWNQKEVTCVLSGMNSLAMVIENCASADASYVGEFSEKEEVLLEKIVSCIRSKMKVGCTGCGYCMPCPKKVDIPQAFSAYNQYYSESKINALREYMMCTLLRKNSTSISNCVECGKCEKHCPQHIAIPKQLKNAQKTLEGPIYKVAKKIVSIIMKF